jgi:hypothetical protein
MDRREYHRAQLRLPVRLRWNTPFGQKTETSSTVDVSRAGLLVNCSTPHPVGTTLWVTFPYDSSVPDIQPEVLARVVRLDMPGTTWVEIKSENTQQLSVDAPTRPLLGLRLYPKRFSRDKQKAPQIERRAIPRRVIALPVRVRPQGIPWFEETMTVDISESGVRFLSNREYRVGDVLFLSIDLPLSAHWPAGADLSFQVVRLEAVPQSASLSVAVSRAKKAAEVSLPRHAQI